MINRIRSLMTMLTTLILLGLAPAASADSVDFGDYRVEYSIFSSTFLLPEIAKQYKLQRSQSIGVVNVSIMKKQEDGGLKPVGGQVEGQVFNDLQQSSFLGFRRVTEGEAVYFLAQFQYNSGELLTFQLTARPQGEDLDLPVRATQTLYNDRQ